jgi:sugar phosphate isomerase/epimerase
MFSSLMPGMLGIQCSFDHAIDLAARHGFQGVDVAMDTLASLTPDDVVRLREKFAATGTRPGYCALPTGQDSSFNFHMGFGSGNTSAFMRCSA